MVIQSQYVRMALCFGNTIANMINRTSLLSPSREYLTYLDEKNISYIVTGNTRIDLAAACETLKKTFGIEKLGIVGGPAINTAFLDAGLLDEVMVLIGAGIDGRASVPAVFHREGNSQSEPTPLKLIEVRTYDSGVVFIRYKV